MDSQQPDVSREGAIKYQLLEYLHVSLEVVEFLKNVKVQGAEDGAGREMPEAGAH